MLIFPSIADLASSLSCVFPVCNWVSARTLWPSGLPFSEPTKLLKLKIYKVTLLGWAQSLQLFVTPCIATHLAPLSMGILQAKILEWVSMSSSKESSQPSNPGLRHYRWILYHLSHLGSPHYWVTLPFIWLSLISPLLILSLLFIFDYYKYYFVSSIQCTNYYFHNRFHNYLKLVLISFSFI